MFVLWEEPLDHDRGRPYPNATRSAIRANFSADNGATWSGPRDLAALTGAYANHPEVAVGPAGNLHIVDRISRDQATVAVVDPIGFRTSGDYGATWGPYETAVDDPSQETHPYNLVASTGWVHVAAPTGLYARRPLQ